MKIEELERMVKDLTFQAIYKVSPLYIPNHFLQMIISKLYSLVEFKNSKGEAVRQDAKFDKRYPEGKYDADPTLRRIIDWGKVSRQSFDALKGSGNGLPNGLALSLLIWMKK